MSEIILQACRVTKTYPVKRGVLRRPIGVIRAVEGVDLTLTVGDSLGLVGESGCGKSTLARLLTGLLPPTGGDVRFHRTSLPALRGEARRAFHREIQMIFQNPAGSLDPRMRVEVIVAEPLMIHRLVSGAARQRRVGELLEMVQLSPQFLRRRPRELSGGERQRVAIARALATEPRLLVCDEPIAALDVSVGAQLLQLLGRLATQRSLALVFISHDLQAVARVCRRVAVMYCGRIVEVAPTAQLLSSPWHPYTELLLRCASLDLQTPTSGERPSSLHPPSGCRFRTRCPLADSRCAEQDPALLEKAPGRWVACLKRP